MSAATISVTPNALLDPPSAGSAITTAPPNPISRPANVPRAGNRCASALATAATERGVAPFNIPVSADDTCCSANGNMLSGNANHNTPSAAVPAQSARATGRRADGNRDSVKNPIAMRLNVTPLGATAARPSAMNRNDAPQMTPGTTSSATSTNQPFLSAISLQSLPLIFRTSE